MIIIIIITKYLAVPARGFNLWSMTQSGLIQPYVWLPVISVCQKLIKSVYLYYIFPS